MIRSSSSTPSVGSVSVASNVSEFSNINSVSRKSASLMEAFAAVGHPLTIYNIAICATFGSALFGYDTGVINGVTLLLKEEFHLEEDWIADIVSSTTGAAAIFSLPAGLISDRYGRKMSIMMSAVVSTVGGVFLGVANGPDMLLVGRIAVGMSIGVVSTVVPVYVSECAPANIRGSLITLFQLNIVFGIFLAAILAAVFESAQDGWRYMLGLSSIFGIMQYVVLMALPESPRFYVLKNNLFDAQRVLRRIRNSADVTLELDEINDAHRGEPKVEGLAVLKQIMLDDYVRYTLFVGCMLQFFQQFTGINAVIYYISYILKSTGFNLHYAIWLSIIPATVNFLATFSSFWAVEMIGRRISLVISFLAAAVAMLVLMIAFLPEFSNSEYTDAEYESDFNISGHCLKIRDCWTCAKDSMCGFCGATEGAGRVINGSCVQSVSGQFRELYAQDGRCSRKPVTGGFKADGALVYLHGACPLGYPYIAVAGLILFVLAFAPGAGPMPWTINAEIYPLWSRSIATSITTMTNWSCNYVLSKLFLVSTKTITTWGTFLVFAVMCVLGAIFTFLLVPETKDRTLEDIGRNAWAAPRTSEDWMFPTDLEAVKRAVSESADGVRGTPISTIINIDSVETKTNVDPSSTRTSASGKSNWTVKSATTEASGQSVKVIKFSESTKTNVLLPRN